MSERLTRRELKKDEFLEAVLSGATWAKAHVLIAIAAALAIVLAVTLAFRLAGDGGKSGATNPKAERALADARAAFGTGGLPAGITALEEVRSQHGGSVAGREATFLLANALFEAGEFDRAKSTYQEFLKKPLHQDLLIDGAKLGIAGCDEETARLAEATKGYLEIWKNGLTPGTRLQGGLSAARCHEAQGANPEAIALYDEIVAGYPLSPEAAEAKFAKARLESGGSNVVTLPAPTSPAPTTTPTTP